MSEEVLIRYCAPTLAGLKTGNLFTYLCPEGEDICETVRKLNRRLVPKGLRVLPLRRHKGRVLIYVYRPDRLKSDFSKQQVSDLLREFGYPVKDPDLCVAKLANRLHDWEEFPHEIGLFLGYPAEDVRGFIDNKAAKSKCVGCWKVYGDEEKAKKLFRQYEKCTDVYCRQWRQGKNMERLVVAESCIANDGKAGK